nr:hypothetical protein [uncultured bacterium]
MPNRLINETSPYLLQHAHNPVDWYPWGEEAFRRAREEDKPILLSIGYSACHWCHVMERECFENPEIARLMNENFVNIKVDREERPDVDAIYMQAVQAMTGSGGWPLTVFLTPDGEPFFGGTYFPPEDRHGLPAFPRVLLAIADAYRNRRGDIVRQAQQLVDQLRRVTTVRSAPEPLTTELLHQAFLDFRSRADPEFGGFGPQPKFPQPFVWEFLLRYWHRTGIDEALALVETTLEAMARGGIYDHLGGGFHRYSTDRVWLVPHFEKMLYDNALLVRLYLHAYQATGRPLYRRVVEETVEYLLREMRSPEGGFYSAQDADSEEVEGKFYVWDRREIMETLGDELGQAFCRYYGVTEQGNFEGRNVLHVPRSARAVAEELGIAVERLEELLAEGRRRLLAVRQRRVPPGRDEKVLTNWNGLALEALAEAACVLARPDYREAAEACARFLLERAQAGGRLMHSYKDGQARVPGYLDDYACLIGGLLALHEATFDTVWLREAARLATEMLSLFWDDAESVFYDTGHDHEALVVRPRELFDNATPSGNSAAVAALLRLGALSGDSRCTDVAQRALRGVRDLMLRAPSAMANWLCALDFYLSSPREIAIVGQRDDPAADALLAVVYRRYLPNKVVAGLPPDQRPVEDFALLQGRTMLQGRPTAYVCQNYACRQPVTSPEELDAQLSTPEP